MEATELLAGLGSALMIFKRLLGLGVGTEVIEAEAKKIMMERLSGSMGHHLLLRDKECENQSLKESELQSQDKWEEEDRRFWREEKLVMRLLSIRMKEVRAQEKRARKAWDQVVRPFAALFYLHGRSTISGLEPKCPPPPSATLKNSQNLHKSSQPTLESSSIQTAEPIVKYHTILEMGAITDLHILSDPVSDFWKCPKKGFKNLY